MRMATLKNLMDIKQYQRILKADLPGYMFKAQPQRLYWLLLHACIILSCSWMIVKNDHMFVRLLLGGLIGNSLGTLGFLGHEILHGTVVKSRKLILLLGSICMAHWGLYGKAWIIWHNKEHHSKTQHPFDDPDCFGRIEMYLRSSRMQMLERFIPGSLTAISFTFLFWFFSFHTGWIVLFNRHLFSKKKDWIESVLFLVLSVVGWPLLVFLLFGMAFLPYLWLTPLLISNLVFMSYVATNHFLNPLTPAVNDPLVNSLTVRTPAWMERLHLNNGYHTEHHLFPHVNPRFAPLLNQVLKSRWPERYNEMNFFKAIRLVYQTPRIYFNDTTQINPRKNIKVKCILFKEPAEND